MLSLVLLLVAGCAKPEDDIMPVAEWVDLGLPSGLLWAACNVGATYPEEYGDYFAWGEIEPNKEVYDSYTYRFYDEYGINKYNYDPRFSALDYTDTLTILEPSDDAATAHLADARIPAPAEFEELMNNTTSKWDTLNGVRGRRFTGPNSNSIFFPAADFRQFDYPPLNPGVKGHYWTNKLTTDTYPNQANVFFFMADEQYISNLQLRQVGLPVRAVRSNKRS